MARLSDHREPEMDDYQRFLMDLRRLDQSTRWFWWLSVGLTMLVLTALVVHYLPKRLATHLPGQLVSAWLLHGLLATVLLSNIFTLVQQRRFKSFRNRLVEQMDAATKHRDRADTFYGMSIIDSLTGLYNRRFGEQRLRDEIARAESKKEDLAVIALDLDNFKPINDRFGHAAGDLVLKEFSRRLRRAIRACDTPVRLGGDEFLVILPECSNENVNIIFSRLGPFDVILDRQKIPVCCSRGRAQYEVGDTPETLSARADQRLYAEKQARKNPAVPETETESAESMTDITPCLPDVMSS